MNRSERRAAEAQALVLTKDLRRTALRNGRKAKSYPEMVEPASAILGGWKILLEADPRARESPAQAIEEPQFPDDVRKRRCTELTGHLLGNLPKEAVQSISDHIAPVVAAIGALRGKPGHVLFVLSMSLYPRGRGSNDADWHFLGRITASFGAPEQPTTPYETTHPNDTHYWVWSEPEAS